MNDVTRIEIDTIDRPMYKEIVHGKCVEYRVSSMVVWDFRKSSIDHVIAMCKPTNSNAKYDRMREEFNALVRLPAVMGMQDGNIIFLECEFTTIASKVLRFATKEELSSDKEVLNLIKGSKDLVWEPILIADDGLEDMIPYPILASEDSPLSLYCPRTYNRKSDCGCTKCQSAKVAGNKQSDGSIQINAAVKSSLGMTMAGRKLLPYPLQITNEAAKHLLKRAFDACRPPQPLCSLHIALSTSSSV